jgi:cytochrome c-type biogenesis protein CcmE
VDNGSTVLFTLTDGHRDVNVSYTEHQPVNIVEGNHAAVTGKLHPDNTIYANQIITKCPSKYSTEATALETKE